MNALGVVRHLFDAVFDAVLPPRARDLRTKSRQVEDIPLTLKEHELLGVQITTIMAYKDPAAQDLVRALKYDGSGSAASLAAGVLCDYLREEIANARQFSAREILLVPIPLHRSRERERGFNQIKIVLNALPKEFRDGTLSRLAPELLVRVRPTKQQTKLPRHERIKNMTNAFVVPNTAHIGNAHIFLIDDVATTGATLKHAGNAFKGSGARVTLLALARA